MSAGIACRVLPHARLRARLFPEDEVDRQYQAEETCEVVPAQGVRLHENQREQREDRERDYLLDDFQLPDRERPAELRRPDAVGRNLEAVFEQGDAPAQQTMASMPKRSSLDLNAMWPYQASVMKAFDKTSRATVAIPLNICHTGLKPRKSINFFRMICAPRKKKPSATFFYRDGGRVSGVRCVWVRPAAGSVGMPCDRRCCRSAAARSLPGWGDR